jgi:hypothetical protein
LEQTLLTEICDKTTPSQILTFSYIGMKTQSMAAIISITMIADELKEL